jgi:hypothetical protein
MRMIAVALTLMCLRAQTALPPDLDSLTKIRTRMLFNLAHQPNYTCVETIERSTRAKPSSKLKLIDTLRMEVALVNGRELFAWPGSKKFEDTDVTQMVSTGAIGNGDFGIHAEALFGSRSATFHYLGLEDFQGRKAIRFDYNVPQMLSAYHIRVATASAVVGYHGSFYADPVTFDMERIEVMADDLPPALLLASTEDKIDYAVARIGEGDFLLPSQSELSMIGLAGREEHNQVRFTSCRQFSGESVVTFDEAPATKPEAAPIPTREFQVPAGLDIMLVIAKAVDFETAAVGDPVFARVDGDVKQKGVLIIPKGATAMGRITRLEKNENNTILGLEFPEIDAPGILARMQGSLLHSVGFEPLRPRQATRMRSPLLPGEGVVAMPATQRHMAKGCIMFWRTQIK